MARQRSGFARTPSREKSWSLLPGGVLGFSTDSIQLAPGSLSFVQAATIVRCRGELLFSMDALTDGAQMDVTVGLAIVSSDALAVGATAMPDPGNDPDYPWLYWKGLLIQSQTGGSSSAELVHRVEVDSKAMRKVKPKQSLVWVAQSVRLNGTPNADLIFGGLRVLVYE